MRGLLGALLPSTGADIKGTKDTAQALQAWCGYEGKPREFAELVKLLNSGGCDESEG